MPIPNLRTAAEWAERIRVFIPDTTVWSLVKERIAEAFEGYARQQVEAERDRLLDEFSAALRERGMTPQRQVYPFADALNLLVQKQVEAFRERVAQLCDEQEIGEGTDTGRMWRNTMRNRLAAAIRALKGT